MPHIDLVLSLGMVRERTEERGFILSIYHTSLNNVCSVYKDVCIYMYVLENIMVHVCVYSIRPP